MKKYSVTLLEHVRHTYEVKANNEEQADPDDSVVHLFWF